MEQFYAPKGKLLWDSWFIKYHNTYHLFHLSVTPSKATDSRPNKNISIGHAISNDLRTWTELPTALKPGAENEWDSLSLWTGSALENDGVFYMVYTGRSDIPTEEWVQRIGLATSTDLVTWEKHGKNPILEADNMHYSIDNSLNALGNIGTWRDPYLFFDPQTQKYYMLISAREKGDKKEYNGCIGIAESSDLLTWNLLPPLFSPHIYDEMEVPQMILHEGRYYLFFSTHASGYEPTYAAQFGKHGGRHCYVATELFGTYHPVNGNGVVHSHEDAVYDITIVPDTNTQYTALGWLNKDLYGRFVGKLSHPFTITISGDHITCT